MTSRTELGQAYDRHANEYGAVRNPAYDAFRDEMLDWFAERVRTVGQNVLDLGAGPGREAVLLHERGLRPLAIDLSQRMVDLCRSRGITAERQDLYDLQLPHNHFAGAWISFSLLHVPKQDVPGILAGVRRLLMPGGLAMVLLFEGDGEGPREDDRSRYGTARYFAYYRADELRNAVASSFQVVLERRLGLSPRPTLVVAGVNGELNGGVP